MTDGIPDVVVGRVGRAHGLAGHVIIHPETDNPRRFAPGSRVHAGERVLTVAWAQAIESGIRVKFEAIDHRSGAEALRGVTLTIASGERRRLEDGEFWPEDLVGLAVLDASGDRLGVVSEVIEGVAQDRLAVSTEHGRVEVPFVADLVPEVDLARGHVRLADVGGLLDPPSG